VYSEFSFDLSVVAILCKVDFEIKVDSLGNGCWNAGRRPLYILLWLLVKQCSTAACDKCPKSIRSLASMACLLCSQMYEVVDKVDLLHLG
jgi:hypothetical protein